MNCNNTAGSRQWEVRKHWHEFLVTSSVRGLKRTTTSETRFLRLFWVAFLLASLVLMLYQIVSVIETYVAQKDSTAMQSKRLDILVPFPAVSVCREAAYASHEEVRQAMLRHNASVTTRHDYSRRVADLIIRNIQNVSNMSQAELDLAQMTILMFDTSRSYQAQVPRAAIKSVALPLIRQLAAARANFDNGSSVILTFNMDILGLDPANHTPSSSFDAELSGMRVRDFYHWRYFLCQTMELTMSEEDQGDLQSLDLLLWHTTPSFNTSGPGAEDRAFPMSGLWSADGIRLALHPAGQHGRVHIDNNGMLVQSGGYTDIRFSPSVTRYLNCSDQQLVHGDQGPYNYNLNDCKYLSFDRALRQKCNCTLDPLAWDWRQCARIDWDSLENSDWGSCMGTAEWSRDSCARPACTQTDFYCETAFAPWNINDYQWSWIIDILLNRDESLPRYLAVSQLGDRANDIDYSAKAMQMFRNAKDNLVSLTIHRQSGLVSYQQEVRLTSIANLFSSCGGAMSLFMGITLTLLAEFFEFIYQLCRQGCRRRATSTTLSPLSLKELQDASTDGSVANAAGSGASHNDHHGSAAAVTYPNLTEQEL